MVLPCSKITVQQQVQFPEMHQHMILFTRALFIHEVTVANVLTLFLHYKNRDKWSQTTKLQTLTNSEPHACHVKP